MAIALKPDDLLTTLELAVKVARSKEPLPSLWTKRTQDLGDLGVVAYVAALGGALIARATDERVDSYCQDADAGPRGYSLRKVAEFLVEHNHGRYDLGSRSKNPMNSRPFLGGPGRIDEFTKIAPRARPSFDLFLDCIHDLSKLNKAGAAKAFAAFLQVRMRVAAKNKARQRVQVRPPKGMSADDLLRIAEAFVRKNVEGGRTGQAFVAAVLDCVSRGVELLPINAPHPGDVRVRTGGGVTLMIEVKQVGVDEAAALKLAEDAAKCGASSALLVVLAAAHAPLDRDRIRAQAGRQSGVALEVCESVRELAGAVAVFNGGRLPEIRDQLPSAFAARMAEIGVSASAQARWRQLLAARG